MPCTWRAADLLPAVRRCESRRALLRRYRSGRGRRARGGKGSTPPWAGSRYRTTRAHPPGSAAARAGSLVRSACRSRTGTGPSRRARRRLSGRRTGSRTAAHREPCRSSPAPRRSRSCLAARSRTSAARPSSVPAVRLPRPCRPQRWDPAGSGSLPTARRAARPHRPALLAPRPARRGARAAARSPLVSACP